MKVSNSIIWRKWYKQKIHK